MRDTFLEGILLDGRYETLAPLNHGSFGMVFMAKDMTSGDIVAIKCLTKKPDTGCPSTFSVDDKSEELACHTLLGSHPNIVNFIDSFESDSHVYIVLEYCPNGDLYEAIRHGRGPLETEHVRDFMLQLVDAVASMHAKGIYHRDIKPENIFLSASGAMKLGDFGLATRDAWTVESTVGSDRYMSPEQYDPAGVGYSPEKADVWAVGICLLNILFSRNPFVTPTESDPLFADFVRDPQSMFDIFPTMSQDTFEVLAQSLAIEPTKRSLSGLRDALNRVISFTTDDELLDDFCTDDREAVQPTANREPLRTPSISSPQLDQGGAFPWAKALHMSPPQQVRQLSTIADNEAYPENLFAESIDDRDWYAVKPRTASIASALDSGLGASLKSLPLRKIEDRAQPPRSQPVPISGSVPLPSMASVFGKGDIISKSWSDLWDEDEEEAERERQPIYNDCRSPDSRSWSRESKDEDRTIQRLVLSEQPSSNVNTRTQSAGPHYAGTSGIGFDGVNENDGFFFEDHHPQRSSPPRYSPPARRSLMDKWAALGDKRRAYVTSKSSETSKFSSAGTKPREFGAFGASGFSANGAWDKKDKPRHWSRGRREDTGDFEWVGGWHDLHL